MVLQLHHIMYKHIQGSVNVARVSALVTLLAVSTFSALCRDEISISVTWVATSLICTSIIIPVTP